MKFPETVHLVGPLSLVPSSEEQNLFSLPFESPGGVYLFTVPVEDSYTTYYVGMSRDIKSRMRQHIRMYLCGSYWLYEPEMMRQGILRVIHNPCEPEDFLGLADEKLPKVMDLLNLIRIFALGLPSDTEILKRVESKLINVFCGAQSELFKLENTRVSVSVRPEERVLIKIVGAEKVHGLPPEISA